MATWQAIVGGTTYNLSDGNPFKVLSISGIGNAPVRRLEERGPFQDGSTDIGYRLDARLINIAIQITGASLSATDTHRDTLGRIFNPRGGTPVYLRCTRDDGAVRQIDCYVTGMLDMPAELGQRDMAAQRVGVQLKAPNPIWYNPTANNVTLSNSSGLWYHGNGMWGASDVVTWSTAIAGPYYPPKLWEHAGTVAAGSAWTILARMPMNTSQSGQYAFFARGIGGNVNHGISRAPLYTVNATVPLSNDAGTATYFLESDGADIQVYKNNTLLGYINGAGTTGLEDGAAESFPSMWGAFSGTADEWTYEVTHAAVYRMALTSAQRQAMVNILDGVPGNYYAVGTVSYSGTWDEYPVITITGPLVGPVITNITTGETLDFTGATIPANQTYTIDCRYGYKTVIDSSAANQIAKLSNDSDLATFHIVPGLNPIQVVTDDAYAYSDNIRVQYKNAYLGL